MKCLKMLGLVAVAASALIAFTGTASATTWYSPVGTPLKVGDTVHTVSPAWVHTVLDSPIGKIECNHTAHYVITNAGGNHGGAGPTTPVRASVSTNFTNCTTATVHVLKSGTLSATSSGGGKNTLSSTGAEWTIETFGLHCVYATNNTAIGTLTGGSPASIAISATIPRTGGKSGAFCGSSAPLTGSSTVTSPNPLIVS